MADTPVANVGDVAQNNAVVTQIVAAQANNQHTACSNPDQARILMTTPDGYQYTDVASCTVQVGSNSVTLFREPK